MRSLRQRQPHPPVARQLDQAFLAAASPKGSAPASPQRVPRSPLDARTQRQPAHAQVQMRVVADVQEPDSVARKLLFE